MLEVFLATGSTLYGAALKGIHYAYEKGIFKIHHLNIPVVSVGNLTWGGTGKTPVVMQLAKGFQKKGKRVAVLTRGYGRDEAQLLTQRLSPIPVLVNPDRVAAGAQAVKEHGADILLLDDGYQQWRLKKDVEDVKGNKMSSLFSVVEEPLVAPEKIGFRVTLRGEKGIYVGKEEIKTQPMIYRVLVRSVPPTDWNPYGLLIEEIDQEVIAP